MTSMLKIPISYNNYTKFLEYMLLYKQQFSMIKYTAGKKQHCYLSKPQSAVLSTTDTFWEPGVGHTS